MSIRSVVLLLVVVIVAQTAFSQAAQPSNAAEPKYLQHLTPIERKDYEELKADWEKQRKDAAAFKKLLAKMTLQSQMILGRFGYGTIFTGVMDEQTRDALRAYQTKRTLPISGELDPITYYWLTKDDTAADSRVTGLGSFWFGFYDDYVTADGA